MKLTCPIFQEGENIPQVYTCEGKSINPPLEIHGVPAQAKSLVLIMDDPDVPAFVRPEKIWDHWVVYNIPPQTRTIAENSKPHGVMGKNTSGDEEYEGPCPPDREHRYFFKLYALDCLLPLPKGATKHEVEKAMKGHILSECQLMGRYEKKKKH